MDMPKHVKHFESEKELAETYDDKSVQCDTQFQPIYILTVRQKTISTEREVPYYLSQKSSFQITLSRRRIHYHIRNVLFTNFISLDCTCRHLEDVLYDFY